MRTPSRPRREATPSTPVGTLQADAILFDLDGTLVDSAAALVRCWTSWAIEYGVSREKFAAAATHGRTSADLVASLLPAAQVEAALARIGELEAADVHDVVALPGAHELLAALPHEQWAIVTSGNQAVANARIQAARLQPRVLVTADDVRHGKPHPEPFLLGAQRLGVPPERCLVIEDAPAGLAAAKTAGMRSIAVTTSLPAHDLHEADTVVEGLHMLRLRLDGGPLTITTTKPA